MNQDSFVEQESLLMLISDTSPLDSEFRYDLERVLSSSLNVEVYDVLARHSPFALPWLEIALIASSSAIATSILNKIGEDIYSQFKHGIGKALDNRKKNKQLIEDRNKALEQLKAASFTELKEILKLKENISGEIDHAAVMEMLNSPDISDYILDYVFGKMRITITINANDLFIQGRFVSESYETLIEAIQNVKQMVIDARKKKEAGLAEILQSPDLYNESDGIKQTPAFREGLWFSYHYNSIKKEWEFHGVTLYRPDPETGHFCGILGETDRVFDRTRLRKRQ